MRVKDLIRELEYFGEECPIAVCNETASEYFYFVGIMPEVVDGRTVIDILINPQDNEEEE